MLRQIEERELLGVDVQRHVVSTGGSAVYSDVSMRHLGENGIVVFLDVSLSVLEARVCDFGNRGLARRADQSFEDLFDERYSLYRKYADLQIDCDALNQDEACDAIIAAINNMPCDSA